RATSWSPSRSSAPPCCSSGSTPGGCGTAWPPRGASTAPSSPRWPTATPTGPSSWPAGTWPAPAPRCWATRPPPGATPPRRTGPRGDRRRRAPAAAPPGRADRTGSASEEDGPGGHVEVHRPRPELLLERPRAGALDAAERGVGRGADGGPVDAAHAGADLRGEALGGGQARRAAGGGQPVGRVVGPGQGLVEVGDPLDADDRAEDLLVDEPHAGPGPDEQRRLPEPPVLQVGAFAAAPADDDLGAVGHRLLDDRGHGLHGVLGDERPGGDALAVAGAQHQGPGPRRHPLDELVVDLLGDED